MTRIRRTQVAITGIALAGVLVHIIWPRIRIDAVTVFLLALAVIPWLIYLFKSVELPGGLKFEFQEEVERVRKAAEDAGMLNEAHNAPPSIDYTFQAIASQDPTLATAGLRIEIERRIRKLAELGDLEASRQPLKRLLPLLVEKGLLRTDEEAVIAAMLELLNLAAHGHGLDLWRATRLLESGVDVLTWLDADIAKATADIAGLALAKEFAKK